MLQPSSLFELRRAKSLPLASCEIQDFFQPKWGPYLLFRRNITLDSLSASHWFSGIPFQRFYHVSDGMFLVYKLPRLFKIIIEHSNTKSRRLILHHIPQIIEVSSNVGMQSRLGA